MTYNSRISGAVQDWRRATGLSVRGAADVLGLSYDALRSRLYHPHTVWTAPQLERLAAAGVDVPLPLPLPGGGGVPRPGDPSMGDPLMVWPALAVWRGGDISPDRVGEWAVVGLDTLDPVDAARIGGHLLGSVWADLSPRQRAALVAALAEWVGEEL